MKFDMKHKPAPVPPKSDLWQKMQRQLLADALAANDHKLTHTAMALGLSVNTVRSKAVRYGLWPHKRPALVKPPRTKKAPKPEATSTGVS